ncbi:hypothetical protein AB3662_11285 [Sorangium cellulosum]|uniref:hypothetical protein n=1 Tax=Sorangium cellulosum TaxID=56 RepID=UPI003D9A111F
MSRQHGDRAIRMIERQTRERDGAEHIQNMVQLMPVLLRTSKRFHMQRVLLGEPSRNNQLGELSEGCFPARAETRFAPAQLVDREPDITERGALARGSLLQQRHAEHDLPGCKQAPGEVGQHVQTRVGFVLGPARRQAERGSTGLAEAEARGPRLPAQPDGPGAVGALFPC